MKTLTKEEILSAARGVRGGTIARIAYKTEVPLKAEFKKQGYKIIKVVETSVRFGVNYSHIASVIARKSSPEYVARPHTNNYEWVISNRVKHHTQKDKDYIVVANLPKGHHTKTKYLLEGSFVGTLDMGDSIDGPYKDIVIDSYFKPNSFSEEIKTICFDNMLMINKLGTKICF